MQQNCESEKTVSQQKQFICRPPITKYYRLIDIPNQSIVQEPPIQNKTYIKESAFRIFINAMRKANPDLLNRIMKHNKSFRLYKFFINGAWQMIQDRTKSTAEQAQPIMIYQVIKGQKKIIKAVDVEQFFNTMTGANTKTIQFESLSKNDIVSKLNLILSKNYPAVLKFKNQQNQYQIIQQVPEKYWDVIQLFKQYESITYAKVLYRQPQRQYCNWNQRSLSFDQAKGTIIKLSVSYQIKLLKLYFQVHTQNRMEFFKLLILKYQMKKNISVEVRKFKSKNQKSKIFFFQASFQVLESNQDYFIQFDYKNQLQNDYGKITFSAYSSSPINIQKVSNSEMKKIQEIQKKEINDYQQKQNKEEQEYPTAQLIISRIQKLTKINKEQLDKKKLFDYLTEKHNIGYYLLQETNSNILYVIQYLSGLKQQIQYIAYQIHNYYLLENIFSKQRILSQFYNTQFIKHYQKNILFHRLKNQQFIPHYFINPIPNPQVFYVKLKPINKHTYACQRIFIVKQTKQAIDSSMNTDLYFQVGFIETTKHKKNDYIQKKGYIKYNLQIKLNNERLKILKQIQQKCSSKYLWCRKLQIITQNTQITQKSQFQLKFYFQLQIQQEDAILTVQIRVSGLHMGIKLMKINENKNDRL